MLKISLGAVLLSLLVAQWAMAQAEVCRKEESVVYAEPDGKALRMTLFQPRETAAAPRPAVVLIHGGAWIGGSRHQLYWLAREYARVGFVAACIDYRKLPRYPFPACVEDAKAAVRYLRKHALELNIDPQKIIASGHSAGGYIAMMVACTGDSGKFEGTENVGYSSAVSAVVAVHGAVDLGAFREPGSRGGISHRVVKRFLAGLEDCDCDPWEEATPGTYLSDKTCPVLLLHGDADHLVPFESVQGFHQLLLDNKVPVTLKSFPGRDHAFDRFNAQTRPEVWAYMRTFLEDQGFIEPEPGAP